MIRSNRCISVSNNVGIVTTAGYNSNDDLVRWDDASGNDTHL